MDRSALADRITRSFDALPGQLGAAARYVLDNPGDVALLSMREQARRAGVRPWTMTRLAKRLGLDGYEELRALHGTALKERALGFAGKAGAQVARQQEGGGAALARDIAEAAAAQVAALADPAVLEALSAAAARMAAARRIYCLGLRSSYPVAVHFAYALSFLGERAVLLADAAGTGLDALRHCERGDVMLVIGVAPYTRASLEAAEHARERGLAVVALTDSAVSPIATMADHAVRVGTDSPSFLHAMTPAFAAAEILAALIAGAGGEAALAAIGRAESHLAALKVHHLQPAPGRRRSGFTS